jgi:5-methylcytosine-specific restriction endonuclease McrA
MAASSRERARQAQQKPGYSIRANAAQRERYSTREDCRQKNLLRGKQHRTDKPWMAADRARRRRARKKEALHPQSNRAVEKQLSYEAARLTRETGIEHHVDHIIPIAAGGWHHHQNLQVLPQPVNHSKGSDPFWESDCFLDWRDVPEHLWPIALSDRYKQLTGPFRAYP